MVLTAQDSGLWKKSEVLLQSNDKEIPIGPAHTAIHNHNRQTAWINQTLPIEAASESRRVPQHSRREPSRLGKVCDDVALD